MVDTTRPGSAFMEATCARCGYVDHAPYMQSSSPSTRWVTAVGVMMHLTTEGRGGVGDPYHWSLTRRASPMPEYGVEYGCGCRWDIDAQTMMRSAVGGPLYGVEPACPIHRGRRNAHPLGYAMSSGPQGGSVQVTLASPGLPITAPEPRRELELTFETEPIVGFRMWRVVVHLLHGGLVEPRLQPLTGRSLWEPRVRYEAQCLPPANRYAYGSHAGATHEAPHRDCECGTWAVRDRADLPTGHPHGLVAIGEVHLWGRVLAFKKGWRAKYAYPKSLTLLADDQAMADDLARLYGVEVALNRPAKPRALFKQTAGERMQELLRMYGRGFSFGPSPIVQGTEP